MTLKYPIFLISSILLLNACGGGGSSSQSSDASSSKPAQAAKPAAAITDGATVSGSVKFSGAKPKATKIKMSADAYCKGEHTTAVYAEEVVLNGNGTLKNVFVYVKGGLEGKSVPAPSGDALLDQIGCIYFPHVLGVRAGQDITIKNSDGVLHNVNARPKNNKGFNIGQPVKGMKTKKQFAKAEIGIPVKCDVHPWMRSYINVLDHPYFSVSDDKGNFTLKNLPPGTYDIVAWHEKFGTSAPQKVTVGTKETKSISFSFNG